MKSSVWSVRWGEPVPVGHARDRDVAALPGRQDRLGLEHVGGRGRGERQRRERRRRRDRSTSARVPASVLNVIRAADRVAPVAALACRFSAMEIDGKRVLLTGATGGLGRAIASRDRRPAAATLVLSLAQGARSSRSSRPSCPASGHSVAVSDLAEPGAAEQLVGRGRATSTSSSPTPACRAPA